MPITGTNLIYQSFHFATTLLPSTGPLGMDKYRADSSPVHTYNNVRDYTVKLIAANSSGCKDTMIKNLAIGKVGADFTYIISTACTNSAVLFTNASSTVPASVTWDFGDNTTSGVISPNHKFKKAGKYSITMNADFGSCVSSVTKEITIEDRPSAAFEVSASDVCQLPYKAQFTNKSTNAINYKWTFGDAKTGIRSKPCTYLYYRRFL